MEVGIEARGKIITLFRLYSFLLGKLKRKTSKDELKKVKQVEHF